jgi:hypothetical protein
MWESTGEGSLLPTTNGADANTSPMNMILDPALPVARQGQVAGERPKINIFSIF